MKSKLFAAALLLGVLFVSGCGKTLPEAEIPGKAGYVGRLSVIEIDDELFELDGLAAGYELDAASGRLDLYLYDVTFSSRMPVTLSVLVLPDVAYGKDGATLILADDGGIVPMLEMRGELVPYDRYLCTELRGTITPSEMVLSMELGGFRTDYRGSYTE